MSTLLAFRLAKPMEDLAEDTVGIYDPTIQTSAWQGGASTLAAHCSTGGAYYNRSCNSYGSYCNDWVGGNRRVVCDNW